MPRFLREGGRAVRGGLGQTYAFSCGCVFRYGFLVAAHRFRSLLGMWHLVL